MCVFLPVLCSVPVYELSRKRVDTQTSGTGNSCSCTFETYSIALSIVLSRAYQPNMTLYIFNILYIIYSIHLILCHHSTTHTRADSSILSYLSPFIPCVIHISRCLNLSPNLSVTWQLPVTAHTNTQTQPCAHTLADTRTSAPCLTQAISIRTFQRYSHKRLHVPLTCCRCMLNSLNIYTAHICGIKRYTTLQGINY